jgi:hypothetical protein
LMMLCLEHAYNEGIIIESIQVKEGQLFDRSAIEARYDYLKAYWTDSLDRGWMTPKRSSKPRTSVKLS